MSISLVQKTMYPTLHKIVEQLLLTTTDSCPSQSMYLTSQYCNVVTSFRASPYPSTPPPPPPGPVLRTLQGPHHIYNTDNTDLLWKIFQTPFNISYNIIANIITPVMWWRSKRDNTKSKLNENKTEVVIFGKDTTEKQLQIGKSVISSISAATSLGCILDSKLNMSQHVSCVCKSANYYLHFIRKIRNFISMDACKLLVHTLVMVRLDYCNALLCGAREDVIRQLERLQRQAVRVVCKKYKNDHTSVTELMWGLHWLPIRARIQYKILLLVYKAFTNGSPTYLADMMTSCNPVRSTRSSHKVNLLVVPHQKSNKYSEKAFAVVGPRLWNELLTDELRGCNSVDTFKKKLKTMLFKKHY